MVKSRAFLIFIFLLSFQNHTLFSQGWDRSNYCDYCMSASLISTPDGGFLSPYYHVLKLDYAGNIQWKIPYLDATSGILTSQNTYMLVVNAYNKARIVKVDAAGNIIWDRLYGSSLTGDFTKSIIEESPGQYLVTGKFADGVNLMRINENGDSLWSNTSRFSNISGRYIDISSDNNYMLVSFIHSTGLQIIQKINSVTGDTIWTKPGTNNINEAHKFNGDYVASGGILTKYDSDFNVIWDAASNTLLSDGLPYISTSSVILPSGNIMTVGQTQTAGGSDHIFLVKYSAAGQIIWYKQLFKMVSYSQPLNIIYTLQGGLGITFNDMRGRFIKTDTLGNIKANYLQGKVYFDENSSCTADASEFPGAGTMVKLEPGSEYASIDDSGAFAFAVDTGSYTLSVMPPNNLWTANCGINTYNKHLTAYNTISLNNDFLLKPTGSCAKLKVDVLLPRLRKCFKSSIQVNYSNEGITANNVKVKLTLPEGIIPLNTNLPYIISNDTLVFTIGTLRAGERGAIVIEDSISCNLQLGMTQCVSAWISPANYCGEIISPTWDKSSIVLSGKCQGDTLVRFTILNHGESMSGPSQYRLFANNILAITNNFQLPQGQALTLDFPANGMSLRLEADQRPFHPGKSRPRATVEACGGSIILTAWGSENNVALDDEDLFVEKECAMIVGAFDPNEKSVSPQGITADHYIKAEDELQYRVDFQNTGNDTAFTVIIIDTLSTYLDLTTFMSGASSHAYIYKIYPSNPPVIEWTFKNILLPDSNINERKSHGFVNFKIKQKPSNPKGTVIENTAHIIFDFNAPVITNTTRLMVNDTVIYNPLILSVKTFASKYEGKVSVAPNPFNSSTTIKINVAGTTDYLIRVYDLSGREVRNISTNSSAIDIEKGDLPGGLYIYSISTAGDFVATGKLVIE
jgi:uncharacterized repeat protein (TIGR01451 family)